MGRVCCGRRSYKAKRITNPTVIRKSTCHCVQERKKKVGKFLRPDIELKAIALLFCIYGIVQQYGQLDHFYRFFALFAHSMDVQVCMHVSNLSCASYAMCSNHDIFLRDCALLCTFYVLPTTSGLNLYRANVALCSGWTWEVLLQERGTPSRGMIDPYSLIEFMQTYMHRRVKKATKGMQMLQK